MTMTIDEIDAEIAALVRLRSIWRGRYGYVPLRRARECSDEIEKLRRQRLVLTEQTERK